MIPCILVAILLIGILAIPMVIGLACSAQQLREFLNREPKPCRSQFFRDWQGDDDFVSAEELEKRDQPKP